MGRHAFQFLWMLILLSHNYQSEGWFFSSKDDSTEDHQHSENNQIPKDSVAEFSMERLNSRKGMKLVENARRMAVSSNSCSQNAYKNLFAGCSEILAGEERRSKFAWHLSDCFQKDSGRSDFPYCDVKSLMLNCLKKLNEDARKVYLEFFLETNSICHQLQADAFKCQMERLVNELKKTAENAEIKIENIEGRAEQLLRSSNQICDSLVLVHLHTGQVAQTLKNVGDHVNAVLTNSEVVYEQFVGIAASQSELREGQTRMNETMEQGMAMLRDSYKNLGTDISNLGDKAVEIDNQISKVGDAMSSKMNTLQSKAEDIGNITEVSLDKQRELLAGQSAAVEGLQTLNKIMTQALEESKGTMQQLAEFGHRQQEELLRRQKQLEQAHDHLVENSEAILAAQYWTNGIEHHAWITNLVRLLFWLLASAQLLYTIFTYRDCETLNHQMLLILMEKFDGMQKHKELSWNMDSEEDWSARVDADLPEDVDKLEDPDFMLPEEVEENTIATTSITRKYNLRNWHRL